MCQGTHAPYRLTLYGAGATPQTQLHHPVGPSTRRVGVALLLPRSVQVTPLHVQLPLPSPEVAAPQPLPPQAQLPAHILMGIEAMEFDACGVFHALCWRDSTRLQGVSWPLYGQQGMGIPLSILSSHPHQVFEDGRLSDPETDAVSDCSSLEAEAKRGPGPLAFVPQSTPCRMLEQPLDRGSEDLEWDPSVDVGGSTSHDDEDSSYYSAITGMGRGLLPAPRL